MDAGKSARIRSYSLAGDFRQTQPLPTALQIINTSSSKDSLGYLEIVGEVRNNGDTISEYTQIVATFYGADGNLVDVDFTFTDPTTVQSHSQQSFKLTLASATRSSLATRWALDTQSIQYANMQYASIPQPSSSSTAARTTIPVVRTGTTPYDPATISRVQNDFVSPVAAASFLVLVLVVLVLAYRKLTPRKMAASTTARTQMNLGRFCMNCGAVIPGDSKFCKECGARLV